MKEETYHRELEEIQEDIRKLRKEWKDIVEKLQGDGRSRQQDAGQRISTFARERIERIRDAAQAALGNLRDAGLKTRDSLVKQVQEKPVVTLLAAVGIGLLLGRMYRRR